MSAVPMILADNRFSAGTRTATTTAAGSDVLNAFDWRTYTRYEASNTIVHYITVDGASAAAADTLAIASHNLGTAQAEVSVECSSDNFASDVTVALAPFSVADDGIVVKQFDSQTKRYWRVKLDGLSIYPSIGMLAVGARLEFPVPIEGGYTPAKESPVHALENEDGPLLGGMLAHLNIAARAPFILVPDEWYRDEFRPLWDDHLSLGLPAFWCADIVSRPHETILVRWRPGASFSPKYQYDGTRALELDFVGVDLPDASMSASGSWYSGPGGGAAGGGGYVEPPS